MNTGKKYVTSNTNFGATGTASTMVMSGSTVTVTLGTSDNPNAAGTANGSVNMTWTPALGPTDRAANLLLTTAVIEGGTSDLDF